MKAPEFQVFFLSPMLHTSAQSHDIQFGNFCVILLMDEKAS